MQTYPGFDNVTYGMLILAEGRKKEYASKVIERIVHNHITIRLPLKLPCTWVRTYISQTIDTSIYISTSMFTRIIIV